jgi:hypothetical protein
MLHTYIYIYIYRQREREEGDRSYKRKGLRPPWLQYDFVIITTQIIMYLKNGLYFRDTTTGTQ